MLGACSKKKLKAFIIAVIVGVIVFPVINMSAYVPTARSTLPPPERLTPVEVFTDEYQLLFASDYLSFYLTPIGNIAISDKRGEIPFMWKTGLDIPLNSEIDAYIADMTLEERIELAPTREERMSDTFAGFANSMILLEFFETGGQFVSTLGNASRSGITSTFNSVDGDPSRFILQMALSSIDLQLELHIRLMDTGMEFHVPYDRIQGDDVFRLAGIVIAPFMGAGGGSRMHFNPDNNTFDIRVPNPMPPAYALLPDGSGALARFLYNEVSLSPYRASVFGQDVSQNFNHTNPAPLIVPPLSPLMPIYGVAHGQDEFAFFAHAISGGEYMEVIFRPAGNTTLYNCVFPRFEFNRFYFQVFNQLGAGYLSLMNPPNQFDITLHVEFLAGSGDTGFAANYVGMAQFYRDFLISTGVLSPSRTTWEGDIPLHLDILMAESRRSLVGLTNVVTTNVYEVDDILSSIMASGITNLNVSLMGFKDNGFTAARLDRNNFDASIGTRRQLEALVRRFAEMGVDISFAQDYANINEYSTSTLLTHAARHISGQNVEKDLDFLTAWATNMPVQTTNLLRVDRAAQFIRSFADTMDFANSITILGISNQLYSQYNRGAHKTVTDSINVIQGAFRDVHSRKLVNADAPNLYLWAYTDRFLNTPMFTSQFLVTTDTVPFLQMVLHGSVDMFSPRVNFSFYSERDVLRMIDYNVFPAFLLTSQPSYLLAETNSSHMFSTEFSQYDALIYDVYARVNRVLRYTAGLQWLNREVIKPGVVVNTYSGGHRVIINYTNSPVELFGVTVDALSAKGVPGE